MPTYVKAVVRATYWDTFDTFETISFLDESLVESADLLEAAYFISGDRSPVVSGLTGNDCIQGSGSGPVENEFIFVAPDGMFTLPCTALIRFAFSYEPYEVDLLTSSDGVTFTLRGTGVASGTYSDPPVEIALSGGDAPFVPWWTDHNNTQEQ